MDRFGSFLVGIAVGALIVGAASIASNDKKNEFQTKVPVVPGLTITCGQDMTNCDTIYTYSEP